MNKAAEIEMEKECRQKFPAFPYKPYSIQVDFMNALYDSLTKGGIAMLESPTGTGKTLSIICSALQWLLDRKKQQKSAASGDLLLDCNQNSVGYSGPDHEPDWMRNFVVAKQQRGQRKKTYDKKKLGFRSKRSDNNSNQDCFRDIRCNVDVKEDDFSNEKKNLSVKIEGELDDEEFLVEEYKSEDEIGGPLKRKIGGGSYSSSSEEEDGDDDDGTDNEVEESQLKIYFCSRTHSQLSQFIKELKKTSFATELKVVSLGSRKNFCINEDVLKLGNSIRINERCLELHKSKKKEAPKMKNLGAGRRTWRTKGSSGCPMLRKQKLKKQFESDIFQDGPLDIEDLVRLGSKLGTCPYYGSRNMVPSADLVVVPYQSLLSKSTRESLGLDLKNSIVIIDEAHNLADSLISMYDSKITSSQLENVHSHLEKYFHRFRNLLGPGNRRYIQTLIVLTQAFLRTLCSENDANDVNSLWAQGFSGAQRVSDSSFGINEFLFSLNIDNINLVKLLRYVKESNAIHKISEFGDKATTLQKVSSLTHNAANNEKGSTVSGFRALVDMLQSLTNNDSDGRIIISRTKATCSEQGAHLKYVMLTGEKIFSEIVDQAHAVILAGGTLQPIEETRERLFPSLPPDKFHFFSCGHIIPPENILPIAVSRGPSGLSFDFSYNSRSSSIMIAELGLLVCNLVTLVPEGVVVFFSSFDYEAQVYEAWKDSGILDRIMKKKHVFREPRRNTDVEVVLKEYKDEINRLSNRDAKDDPSPTNGAILFAVVGGKVSEGINFSDGMGRCIVMVGLPYASPSDIELVERVKHIEGLKNESLSKQTKLLVGNEYCNGDAPAGFEILRSCKHKGKEYYENLCMKAVNQSIGRAIRHINDYAAILLIDARYTSDSTKRSLSHPTNKLPQWIRGPLISATASYGEVHRRLHQFFKSKRG